MGMYVKCAGIAAVVALIATTYDAVAADNIDDDHGDGGSNCVNTSKDRRRACVHETCVEY